MDKNLHSELKIIFGENVMNTNGLYHVLLDDHSEIYINPITKEFDNRGKYSTLVVLSHVIVAKVLNIPGVNYVVLDKEDFECIYRTQGVMYYLDNSAVCDKIYDTVVIISHTGKKLITLNGVKSVDAIGNNRYLVKSIFAFSDTVLEYRKRFDLIVDTARNKRYLIYKNLSNGSVEVENMQGGKYNYDFKTNKCINKFTESEENLILFDILI